MIPIRRILASGIYENMENMDMWVESELQFFFYFSNRQKKWYLEQETGHNMGTIHNMEPGYRIHVLVRELGYGMD